MKSAMTAGLLAALLLFFALPGAEADSRYGVVHGDRFELMKEAGFGWTRMDFVWNGIEPENGTFRFDELDRFVDNCTEAGIEILAILDYSAEWASSGPEGWEGRDRFPPKYLSDWEEYVYETVEHFEGRVSHFEIWNEPNIRYFWFPQPDPKEYFDLLKTAYSAAKRANPDCKVLIGGTIGFDVDFIREVYIQGARSYFDIFAIHPYTGDVPYDMGNFSGNMSAVKEAISEFGDSGKEMWFTEMGWSTSDTTTKEDQADYLVRSYVLSLAMGADKLFWFNLNAAPPPEGSSGLIEHDLAPRPAFFAHKAFAEIVGEAPYSREIELGRDIQGHLFGQGGKYVMVAWSPNSTTEIRIRISSSTSSPGVQNALGEPMQVDRKGKSLLLTLSPSPIFVSGLSERDVKALVSPPSWVVPLVVAIALGIAAVPVYRRLTSETPSKPKRKRESRVGDVPQGCNKTFQKRVCLKCKHYEVTAGGSRCRKFRLKLE